MNELFQALFALLAALSSASGAPAAKPVTLPAKPIIASAPAGMQVSQVVTPSVTPEPGVEITGTIKSVTGTTVLLDNGISVTLGMNAEVKGNLQPGAVVKIEGKLQTNGSILASEIQVGTDAKSKGDDMGIGDDKSGDKGKGDDKSKLQNSVDPIKSLDSQDKNKSQGNDDKSKLQNSVDPIKSPDSPDKSKSQDTVDKSKAQGTVDTNKSHDSVDQNQSHDSPDKGGSQSHDSQDKGSSQPQENHDQSTNETSHK